MNLNFYAHSVCKHYDQLFLDSENLEKVFKSGYLLSRRKLNMSEEMSLYNGMDYISLCDLACRHEEYSAYNMYIKRGISLLFNHDIRVIIPKKVERSSNILQDIFNMHRLGMEEMRYTDLHDEVQIKDMLSLDYLEGILLSKELFYKYYSDVDFKDYLDYIEYLLELYNYKVPIINLGDGQKIDSGKIKKYQRIA